MASYSTRVSGTLWNKAQLCAQIITEVKISPLNFGVIKYIVWELFNCSSLFSGLVLPFGSNATRARLFLLLCLFMVPLICSPLSSLNCPKLLFCFAQTSQVYMVTFPWSDYISCFSFACVFHEFLFFLSLCPCPHAKLQNCLTIQTRQLLSTILWSTVSSFRFCTEFDLGYC